MGLVPAAAVLLLGEGVEQGACCLGGVDGGVSFVRARETSFPPTNNGRTPIHTNEDTTEEQANERDAPRTAMAEPTLPRKVVGVRKTMQEATMMTTRLRVLATECVTGESLERARKENSL